MMATLIPHLESSSLEIDENIAKAAFVEQYAAIIFIGISAVGRMGAKKKLGLICLLIHPVNI